MFDLTFLLTFTLKQFPLYYIQKTIQDPFLSYNNNNSLTLKSAIKPSIFRTYDITVNAYNNHYLIQFLHSNTTIIIPTRYNFPTLSFIYIYCKVKQIHEIPEIVISTFLLRLCNSSIFLFF